MNGRANVIGDLHKAVRALKAARMLPMKGVLTPQQHDDVRKEYTRHTFRFSVSDAAALKAIGIPASTFSQWKNGKYNGAAEKNDEITRLVNGWIERDLRQRLAGIETDYVPTQIAENMKAIIDTAWEQRCMAAIISPSGTGKSLVAETMSSEMNGFYCYVDQDDTTLLFMRKLAKLVGVDPDQPGHRTAGRIKQAIIDKLKGSGRPIFVDEAHNLPPQVFGRLRSIHDQAGCPVIFLGTDQIIDRINDRAGSAGQMASRCIQWNTMEHVINAEDPDGGKMLGRPLFTREEIQTFLRQQDVKLTSDGFERAWATACLPGQGSLRTVSRAVRLAAKINPGQAITATMIDSVLATLLGSQGRAIVESAKRHIKLAATMAA